MKESDAFEQQVQMPSFCQFRFAELNSPETVDCEVFELIGIEKLWVPGGPIRISILGAEYGAAS